MRYPTDRDAAFWGFSTAVPASLASAALTILALPAQVPGFLTAQEWQDYKLIPVLAAVALGAGLAEYLGERVYRALVRRPAEHSDQPPL